MYGKYRIVAYDANDREIGAHVYDGTPEEVQAEMTAYLLEKGFDVKRFEISIVSHESQPIR